MRVFLGAFGDPGHAFPMLALGEALIARGHDVAIDTWERWREPAEAAGMTFAPAPEYQVWPTDGQPLKPYQAAVHAARETRSFVASWRPDVAVSDILTPAPALAAELEGVPVATLVPHVHPDLLPGFPIYSIGARLPRTRAGAAMWRHLYRLVEIGLRQGRDEYNDCRARLGLPPLRWVHTGLSRSLTLVATLPQLEYPRPWPDWLRVVGPLLWEPPGGEAVEPPPGEGPVVLLAPSTSQDPSHRLLRATLEGLADLPVRLIAVDPQGVTVPAPAISADRLAVAGHAGASPPRDTPGAGDAAVSSPADRPDRPHATAAARAAAAPAPVDAPDRPHTTAAAAPAPADAPDRPHDAPGASHPAAPHKMPHAGRPSPAAPDRLAVPPNAVVVPWLSYAKTMPHCDLVICHGGHGTVARALASARPLVVCPAGGDMAENAARVDWAGVGVRLPPRFCTPWGVRLAVTRALSRPTLRSRAGELAAWATEHPGPATAAQEVERWAARVAPRRAPHHG